MAKTTEDLPAMEGEGVSPKRIKRLDSAIAAWRDVVTQRMAFTEAEVLKRAKVQEIMVAEGITKYPYQVDDETKKDVVLDKTVRVKMKSHRDDDATSETDIEDD